MTSYARRERRMWWSMLCLRSMRRKAIGFHGYFEGVYTMFRGTTQDLGCMVYAQCLDGSRWICTWEMVHDGFCYTPKPNPNCKCKYVYKLVRCLYQVLKSVCAHIP
jgi:hypothetical protein